MNKEENFINTLFEKKMAVQLCIMPFCIKLRMCVE